jgi:hypothetical protein
MYGHRPDVIDAHELRASSMRSRRRFMDVAGAVYWAVTRGDGTPRCAAGESRPLKRIPVAGALALLHSIGASCIS